MSTPPPSNPPAAWYPDPQGAPQQRWWDGTQWTAHVQRTPPPAYPSPAPVPVRQGGDTDGSHRAAPAVTSVAAEDTRSHAYIGFNTQDGKPAEKNTPATSALILGIIAIVTVPLVPVRWIPALVAIGAIIWGILGIRYARSSRSGKSKAVWGLVLGAVVLPIALIASLATMPSVQDGSNSSGFNGTVLQQKITDDAASQGVVITDVSCPASPSMSKGTTFSCLAKAKDGSLTSATVHVVDSAGSMTWLVFDKLGVQQQIIDGAKAQGASLTKVECPASPSMDKGAEFQCVATGEGGATAKVNVTWQDDVGSLIWEIK
jgi:hypothetical protein